MQHRSSWDWKKHLRYVLLPPIMTLSTIYLTASKNDHPEVLIYIPPLFKNVFQTLAGTITLATQATLPSLNSISPCSLWCLSLMMWSVWNIKGCQDERDNNRQSPSRRGKLFKYYLKIGNQRGDEPFLRHFLPLLHTLSLLNNDFIWTFGSTFWAFWCTFFYNLSKIFFFHMKGNWDNAIVMEPLQPHI